MLSRGLLCENSCHDGLLWMQLVAAGSALLVASVFAYAVLIEKHLKVAAWSLLVMLAALLAWSVLNDAAVHGWGDMKFF